MENLIAARLDMRGTQKQIIAHLEAENAALKAQVASLQRELEAIRAARADMPESTESTEMPDGMDFRVIFSPEKHKK